MIKKHQQGLVAFVNVKNILVLCVSDCMRETEDKCENFFTLIDDASKRPKLWDRSPGLVVMGDNSCS